MESGLQLANRFREVLLNGYWVANTNFKEQLTILDWEIAVTRIHSLNTIEVLTRHIHYYIAGLVRVFEGGMLDIKDKYSFAFTPVQSQEEWNDIRNRLWDDAERFARLVEQIPEEKLTTIFVDEKYGTYRRNIEAMIEHCYYHLGQVVLIRKILLNNNQ